MFQALPQAWVSHFYHRYWPQNSPRIRNIQEFLGATRIRTTVHHPGAHGVVERLYRQLKASPMARVYLWSSSALKPLIRNILTCCINHQMTASRFLRDTQRPRRASSRTPVNLRSIDEQCFLCLPRGEIRSMLRKVN